MIEVDGVPINEGPGYEPGPGWLGAAEIVITTMNEFRRQTEKRQRDRAGTGATASARQARTRFPGSAEFRAAIADSPAGQRALLEHACDWAESLERDWLATLV